MKLSEIADNAGARKKRMRVGRGIGSGKGKTAGRGGKGQTARSGVRIKGFEGGQMPMHRRLPKRGFNIIFALDFVEINLDRVQQAIDAKKLDAGSVINAEALVKSGALRRAKDGVRLLGRGELKAPAPDPPDGHDRPHEQKGGDQRLREHRVPDRRGRAAEAKK